MITNLVSVLTNEVNPDDYRISDSYPIRSIARLYDLDYSDALLYFDAYRIKKYDNPVHESKAEQRIVLNLPATALSALLADFQVIERRRNTGV